MSEKKDKWSGSKEALAPICWRNTGNEPVFVLQFNTILEHDLNSIACYLALRNIATLDPRTIGQPADVLVLMGSSLMPPIRKAAEAMTAGCARKLLVSGGIGHSTPGLYESVARHPKFRDVPTAGRPEADIIFDILTEHFQLDPRQILVENQSTNCGANAIESRRVLDKQAGRAGKMLLIQDPTMQLRTHKSFARAWADRPNVEFVSFAPFVPRVYRGSHGRLELENEPDGIWTFDRFVDLILGEIVRLRDDEKGYGPKGRNFIDHIDVPSEVLLAYGRSAKALVDNPFSSSRYQA